MSHELAGRTALVTGATAGIGEAVARQLAALGAEVVVHGRDTGRGAHVVKEIQADGGTARFVAADLGDPAEVRRLAEAAGDVDILINNAGIYLFGSTADTDDETFDAHFAVNLRAPFILVRELAPGMVRRGQGAIVNLSTFGASVPGRGGGAYGASKAGLELLTKIWADEYGPAGVRVNAVAAGPTRTPGTAAYGEFAEALGGVTTLGRVAEAEEIANAVVFLATPAAGYVSGAVLPVHGGLQAVAPH
ncbi:SDR family NAD(P)-dependent oxidoreductase [Amycolatopsis sp. NPDC101161]|uniref:SDR family NAD(P)-dependent oxidoreductase n=1 Tax=Amycolatopsis sp. NPDC101161 TaxID=3363940 RepID=UPI00382D83FF